MRKKRNIFVAGHTGMVGSAIVRQLCRIGLADQLVVRTHAELDLVRQDEVERFFQQSRPTHVFLAAAKVGGILANSSHPAEFSFVNLQIATNVIDASWKTGVRKLMFLSSSCVYPREAPQPMKESYLWTGRLEPSNEAYAVAKLAGMSMCAAYRTQYGCDFIAVIPPNLYGPSDNYDAQSSHLVAALIRKLHDAVVQELPEIHLWGTGTPRREVMFVDDLAEALIFLMDYSGPDPINIGVGEDWPVSELAALVADIVGFKGRIRFDPSKPDGAPRKLLDVARLRELGWSSKISIRNGLTMTYDDFRRSFDNTTQRSWSQTGRGEP